MTHQEVQRHGLKRLEMQVIRGFSVTVENKKGSGEEVAAKKNEYET